MILVFPDKTGIEGNPNVQIIAASQELFCKKCQQRVKICLPMDFSVLTKLISRFDREHKHGLEVNL